MSLKYLRHHGQNANRSVVANIMMIASLEHQHNHFPVSVK